MDKPHLSQLAGPTSIQAHDRYFTVKDSIEMARFEGEGGEPIFSPDKSTSPWYVPRDNAIRQN